MSGGSRRAVPRARGRNVGALDRGISAAFGLALAGLGLRRRTPLGGVLAALGTGLLGRTVTGRCLVYRVLGLDSSRPGGLAAMRAGRSHRLEEAVTLQCPVGAVERQLRRLEEVPRWLPRAEAVEEIGTRSRWAVKTRDGALVGWDVEIESDAPGRIAWRSVDRSPHPVQGEFLLRSASGGRATELTVSIEHRVALAPRVEEALREELREGLRRFKQLVEAGEIATTRGQPCGRAEMRGGVGR